MVTENEGLTKLNTRPDNFKGKVLYIEDNPANMILIQKLVEKKTKFQFFGAEEPFSGLEIASTEKPDLILLDINLPGMNGYQVLEKLKNNPETSSIPVVALTANAMKSDIEKGMNAGFVEYLTKPVDIPLFLEFLNKIIC